MKDNLMVSSFNPFTVRTFRRLKPGIPTALIYDDVKAGMVTKMSWRFRCGTYYFDQENRTIVHKTVKKIYDVAPVSLPANDDTVINARAWVDGEIARAARREAELNERRRKLRLKINITGGI